MTFAELATEMRLLAFPQRLNPAEVPVKKWHTATGLGELQRRVRCLRDNNFTEVIGDTLAISFQGTTTAPKPAGTITDIWIGSTNASACDFQPGFVSPATMRSLQEEFARSRKGSCCHTPTKWPPSDVVYTIDPATQLIVFYPGIPDQWMALIRYTAIRTVWNDSDLAPVLTVTEKEALRLWLLYKDASDKGCYQNLNVLYKAFEDMGRNASWECNRTETPEQLLRMPVSRLTAPGSLCVTGYTPGCGCTAGYGTTPSPIIAIISPLNDSDYDEGDDIELEVIVEAGSGANIVSVAYYYDGTLIGTATESPWSLTWEDVPPGEYELTAVATDSVGNTTTSSGINVTIAATPTNQTIYYGSSASTTLNEAGILALGTTTGSTFAGSYSFSAVPSTYKYMAWPDSFGSPAATPSGFTTGGFPVAMATDGEGFTNGPENGWWYLLVTVNSVPYRLYRRFNATSGAVVINAT